MHAPTVKSTGPNLIRKNRYCFRSRDYEKNEFDLPQYTVDSAESRLVCNANTLVRDHQSVAQIHLIKVIGTCGEFELVGHIDS